jgi:hypothetical protein
MTYQSKGCLLVRRCVATTRTCTPIPNPSLRCLRLLSNYPGARSTVRCRPSRHCATDFFCSTRNQRGNCDPILTVLAIWRLQYCILQLGILFWCPSNRASIRKSIRPIDIESPSRWWFDSTIQGFKPSVTALIFPSTRK